VAGRRLKPGVMFTPFLGSAGRERREAQVVYDESRSDIGDQTHVAARWRRQMAQDVDESRRQAVAQVQTRDHAVGRRSPRESGGSTGSG